MWWRRPAFLALALLASCATPPARSDHVARTDAWALLQTLNADLLSHDSATSTLERWCADHRLAEPPRIAARRLRDVKKPLPDELRAQLAIDAGEPIAYRHVQLVCGDHVFSEADNWYVPGRLTPEMNRQLDASDEPFGKIVRPLGFRRQTLSSAVLWQLSRQQRDIPRDVLRHTAVLYTSAQVPFSAVVETYQRGLFESR